MLDSERCLGVVEPAGPPTCGPAGGPSPAKRSSEADVVEDLRFASEEALFLGDPAVPGGFATHSIPGTHAFDVSNILDPVSARLSWSVAASSGTAFEGSQCSVSLATMNVYSAPSDAVTDAVPTSSVPSGSL